MKTEEEIFIIVFLLFIWLLSTWEALTQLSRGKIRRILAKDRKLAEKAENWIEDISSYKISLRILTFCSLALTSIFVFLIYRSYRPQPYSDVESIVVVIVAIFCLVLFAELIAKVLILYLDIYILKFTMPVIRILRYSVFFPVIRLVGLIEDRIEEWYHNNDQDDDKATTEDEILSLVEKDDPEGSDNNHLEEDEKRMIKGIFDLDDTPVREIMTPRVDVEGLSVDAKINEARKLFVTSGHSRIPVYQDNIDEIKGIIFAKDFLDESISETTNLEKLIHLPIFIPETKAVGDLLKEIKKSQNHFAVVIDEYGGTSGIITFEDIIEEIVGDVLDEYDSKDDVEPKPVKLEDGSAIVDGRTLICDVNELLETELPEDEDVDTIGGFVCGEMGKIPDPNEETIIENVKVTILEADKRKIISLKLKAIEENNV